MDPNSESRPLLMENGNSGSTDLPVSSPSRSSEILTSTSGHATDIARHTSCELSSNNSEIVHTLSNTFDMFEPPADSGVFPFSTDSIANSTTFEDEMWPEYCYPPAFTTSSFDNNNCSERNPYDLNEKRRATLSISKPNQFSKIWHGAANSNQTYRRSTGTLRKERPKIFQHGNFMQKFKQQNQDKNVQISDFVETIVIDQSRTYTVGSRPSYIFVDQIDAWQKELMIRASPCMQSFFYEISMEPSECPFRRVLFQGLSREQFLLLIRYLDQGKDVLMYLRPEELMIYKRVAFLHGFRQLDSDCDQVYLEQNQILIEMQMERQNSMKMKMKEQEHIEEATEEKEETPFKRNICMI